MSEYGELLHPNDFMPGAYKFIIEYVGGKCTIETKEMVQGIVEQSVRLNKGVKMTWAAAFILFSTYSYPPMGVYEPGFI